jgi:hypothetical protein
MLLLNLALAGVLVYAGFAWRAQWRAAKAREAALVHRKVPVAPPPPMTPLPVAPPTLASGYVNIAQKNLMDKSRNSEVAIEPPPPPPPPPPMPPLPVFHGVMKLPDEPPTVFLSEGGSGAHQAIHPGESIGQFKLMDVSNNEVVLEWQGKIIHKLMDEMKDRTEVAQAQAPVERTAQPAAAPPPVQQSAKGPGEITNFGYKVCQPNDSTPEGSVVDGFRKVITQSAFGKGCRWDPVGR